MLQGFVLKTTDRTYAFLNSHWWTVSSTEGQCQRVALRVLKFFGKREQDIHFFLQYWFLVTSELPPLTKAIKGAKSLLDRLLPTKKQEYLDVDNTEKENETCIYYLYYYICIILYCKASWKSSILPFKHCIKHDECLKEP